MQNVPTVLGSVLMFLGLVLAVTAVFRSLGHRWTLGVHELWLLPLLAVTLMVVGRWLVR